MAESIDGRARELLEAPNFANVSTTREDGTIRSVLVWVHTDGDRVTLNSAEGRAWPNAVRRDPQLTLLVANAENPYEYVEIRGRVADEATGQEAEDDIDALAKKYLGQDTYPYRQPDERRIKFWVEPDQVRLQQAG